jgi:arylsulfatase
VLPLGSWRGKAADSELSRETRFVLKAGDDLSRAEAPAIAGRAFTVTAKFDTRNARSGVIIAQGGSALGYSLFLADGRLHFLARNRTRTTTANTPDVATGAHTAIARVARNGVVTLKLDDQPAVTAPSRVTITSMPVDGLQVGADEGGTVGPYAAPNRFDGAIESVIIELDAR